MGERKRVTSSRAWPHAASFPSCGCSRARSPAGRGAFPPWSPAQPTHAFRCHSCLFCHPMKRSRKALLTFRCVSSARMRTRLLRFCSISRVFSKSDLRTKFAVKSSESVGPQQGKEQNGTKNEQSDEVTSCVFFLSQTEIHVGSCARATRGLRHFSLQALQPA